MKSGSFWAYREAGALGEPDDCDLPEVRCLRFATYTARQSHRCDVCLGAIAPGQRYQIFVFIGDNGWSCDRQHASSEECYAARQVADAAHRAEAAEEMQGWEAAP